MPEFPELRFENLQQQCARERSDNAAELSLEILGVSTTSGSERTPLQSRSGNDTTGTLQVNEQIGRRVSDSNRRSSGEVGTSAPLIDGLPPLELEQPDVSLNLKDQSNRTKVEKLLTDLSDAGKLSRALGQLLQLYKMNEPYAAEAVSAVLLGNNHEVLSRFDFKYQKKLSNKIDFSSLSDNEKQKIRNDVMEAIKIAQSKRPLEQHEIAALALSMNVEQEKHSSNVREILSRIFDRGISDEQRVLRKPEAVAAARETENGIAALHWAILVRGASDPAFKVLLFEFAKAANSKDNIFIARSKVDDIGRRFDEIVNDTIERAKGGDELSIMLAGIFAGGAGRFNSLNNTSSLMISDSVRTKPSLERASRVGEALLEFARNNREAVISALTNRVHLLIPDNGVRLATLGRVLGSVDAVNIPPEARQAIHDGLSSPSALTRESAAKGLIALSAKWNSADMQAIVNNPCLELTRQLRDAAPNIPPGTGRELVRRNISAILNPDQSPGIKSRLSQTISMTGELGLFVDADSLRSLHRYSGRDGARLLDSILRTDPLGEPAANDAMDLQELIARTLLRVARGAVSEQVRGGAIETLTDRDWSSGLRSDRRFNDQMREFASDHLDNPTIQAAVGKWTYRLEPPTLAVQFRESGVNLSDDRLTRLTESAVRQYGSEKVQAVLNRIALFNALTPELRRDISANDAPLNAGRALTVPTELDANIFNALPGSLRKHLTGRDTLLKEAAKLELTDKVIRASDFNSFPESLRIKIIGSNTPVEGDFVPLSVLKEKSIDAPEFNKLPSFVRKALAGTDERLFEGERYSGKSAICISSEEFNKLPDSVRASLRATNEPVSASQALTLLSCGLLDASDSRLNFLSKDGKSSVEERVAALKESLNRDNAILKTRVSDSESQNDSVLGALRKNVDESIGLRRLYDLVGKGMDTASFGVLNPGVTGIDVERKHAGLQWQLISEARSLQARVGEQRLCAAESSLEADRASLALEVGKHAQLIAKGKQEQADRLALSLYGRYGQQLMHHAPSMLASLKGKSSSASVLGRLHSIGETQFDKLPSIPRPGSQDAPTKALALLRQLRAAPGGREYAEAESLRRISLTAIDQAPVLRKLQDVVRVVQEQMTVLQVETSARGTRDESLIEDAKQRVQLVKDTLERFSAEDLSAVRQLRNELKAALARQGKTAVAEPKSRLELEKRIATISQMLQTVDKQEKLELGEDISKMETRFGSLKRYLHKNHTLAGLVDDQPGLPGDAKSLDAYGPFPPTYSNSQKLAELVQEYQRLGIQLAAAKKSGRQRIDDLFEAVNRKEFTPDTLAKWAKTDGLVLGTTLIVSAAAMAMTFGAATPIVAAAIGAGAGIAVNDGIRELQYRNGLRDDASLLGEYLRGKPVEEIDGTKRQMNAVNDVAFVYAKELGLSTVLGVAGSELGGVIGGRLFKELAGRSGAVRQAVLSENRAVMKLLAQNVQQLEHATAAPTLKSFGVAFGRELISQSGFSVADHIARSGVTGAAHRLGVELEENSLIVGAALNVVLSAAHRGVSLKMQLSSALHSAIPARDGIRSNAPREVFYHAQDTVKEQAFIRDLELSGMKVNRTDKGFSATIEGRRVNFNRTAEMSAAGEPEVYSATFVEKPHILDWMDRVFLPERRAALKNLADTLLDQINIECAVYHRERAGVTAGPADFEAVLKRGLEVLAKSKGDPSTARINTEVRLMEMLGEPQFAEAVRLHGEIARLSALDPGDSVFRVGGSREFQLKSAQKRLDTMLSDLSESSRAKLLSVIEQTGDKVKPLLAALKKYEKVLTKGQESSSSSEERQVYLEVLDATRALHKDDTLRALKHTFAAERDYLPPGSYRISTPTGQRVLVTVEPGSGVMRSRIDSIINRAESNGILPKEFIFSNRLDILGGASRDGHLVVRTRESDHLYLSVVDHETGHLHDFSLNRSSGAYKAVDEVYRSCLNSAAKDIHACALALGDQVPPGGPDEHVKAILRNPEATPAEPKKLLEYYANRGELVAEMFAMFLHEQRSSFKGGTKPTYEDMIRNCVSQKDRYRAEVMRHFKPMYETLRSTVFEKFAMDRDAKVRLNSVFDTPQHNEYRQTVERAFSKHGADSPQLRSAFEDLIKSCVDSAKDALIDTLFAREHNFDIATFHQVKLEPELFRKYREYKEFAKSDYSPPTDRPGSSGFTRAVRQAYKLYLENVAVAETIGKKRATSELRDITKTHLNDFVERFAPGVSGDVASKWQLGKDRIDPVGHHEEQCFTRIAHSLSQQEVAADLFRLYLEKQRSGTQVYGKPFVDQLRLCFGDHRAKQLSNFPELYRKLERDVFPYFQVIPCSVRNAH